MRIALDYDGRPKGFAHIQFEELEGAAAAIALSGGDLGGREVHIETTTERTARKLTTHNYKINFIFGDGWVFIHSYSVF